MDESSTNEFWMWKHGMERQDTSRSSMKESQSTLLNLIKFNFSFRKHETEEEKAARLNNWDDFLEGDEEPENIEKESTTTAVDK